MFFLICYDITDDKKRLKISKTLENYGDRVQYSVFECLMKTDMCQVMVNKLKRIINESEDSIRIYRLDADYIEHIEILGKGVVSEDKDYYIL